MRGELSLRKQEAEGTDRCSAAAGTMNCKHGEAEMQHHFNLCSSLRLVWLKKQLEVEPDGALNELLLLREADNRGQVFLCDCLWKLNK